VRLIIFDCDGTLVDSQHMIVEAMTRAFSARSLAQPDRHAVLNVIGLSLDEAIGRLADGAEAGDIRLLSQAYRAAFTELRSDPMLAEPLFPGALDGLRALARQSDVFLGIATGKSRRGVKKFLEHFDLSSYFSTIQTADDAPSKPHPAMIDQAVADVGAESANTVMVGDTSYDMIMAQQASVCPIGVAWGYHPASELARAGARTVVTDFPGLVDVIETLNPSRTAA